MSDPVWIEATPGELPPAAALGDLASRGRHVVLRIAGQVDRSLLDSILAQLARGLPEHSVFLSGESQLTVLPVICTAEVHRIADDLLEAARAFRLIASQLCARLASALEISTDALIDAPRASGQLDAEWRYRFHGLQCCFLSCATGQVVDIELSFGDEFGVLDPWFFHRFLSTTGRYASVVAHLTHGFHDTQRALDVLENSGRLTRITRSVGDFTSTGLIAS